MRVVARVLLSVVLAGCSDSLTEIVVVADTDMRVPEEIDRIAFSVDASEIDMTMHTSAVSLLDSRPATLGIVHEGGPLGPLTVVAVGRREGAMVVTRRAVVSFVSGSTEMLRLDLFGDCRDVMCRAGLTCASADGECASEAASLLDWPGSASRLDAGMAASPDAGDGSVAIDGRMPLDAPSDAGRDAPGTDGGTGCGLGDAGACSGLDVSAGGGHTCAVAPGGRLFCWGDGASGELGDGLMVSHPEPTEVTGLAAGAVRVSTGADHTCAILNDGTIACWGAGGAGRLGAGATSDQATPVAVGSLGGMATDVSLGDAHTCAVVAARVRCWGDNGSGQVGTTNTMETSPALVPGIVGNVERVSAGARHTCAIADGAVFCWGDNNDGQVGVGAASAQEAPSAIDLMGARAVDIAAGGSHTCALLAGGDVYCWGRGSDGQLGNGGLTQRPAPTRVGTLAATAVSAGALHSCAVTAGGAMCWGANVDGQLGNGSALSRSTTPSAVSGSLEFTSVSAGVRHTCGRLASGTIACWGTAALGEGTSSSRSPVTFDTP